MEVTSEIQQIAQELLERYKAEIAPNKASGDLENTASYKVTFDGKYFEIIFNLESYWKYLENGTKPHFPPVSAIENWITVKHIVPKSVDNKVPTAKNNKVPTTKQLAFLIARGISRNGTKPTKALQNTIDGADDLIARLVDAITNQLQEEINNEEI